MRFGPILSYHSARYLVDDLAGVWIKTSPAALWIDDQCADGGASNKTNPGSIRPGYDQIFINHIEIMMTKVSSYSIRYLQFIDGPSWVVEHPTGYD